MGADYQGEEALQASEDNFRELMSQVCGPVVVATTTCEREPSGTTISAFSSLSAQPRMIMLALDCTSRLLANIEQVGRFGVNILGVGQEELAELFATKSEDKFAGVDWYDCQGLPRLDGACGWASCRIERLVSGGDHIIVLGAVETASSNERAPLVYGRRTFGAHSGLAFSGGAPAGSSLRPRDRL